MKKWLLMIPCLLICCLLMSVPVAAAASDVDVLEGTVIDQYAYFVDVASGTYSMKVFSNNERQELLLYVPAFDVIEGTYEYSFIELDSVFDNVYMSVTYSDQMLQCGIWGSTIHDGDNRVVFGDSEFPDVVVVLEKIVVPEVPVKGGLHEQVPVSVFDVLAGIGTWIISSLSGLSSIFWVESTGTLTVLGTLVVSALGIGVVLGLVAIITKFLKFRS